jgi:transposase-like zinc ribbon protein
MKTTPDKSATKERLRWPEQFACPKCGVVGEPYRSPVSVGPRVALAGIVPSPSDDAFPAAGRNSRGAARELQLLVG